MGHLKALCQGLKDEGLAQSFGICMVEFARWNSNYGQSPQQQEDSSQRMPHVFHG